MSNEFSIVWSEMFMGHSYIMNTYISCLGFFSLFMSSYSDTHFVCALCVKLFLVLSTGVYSNSSEIVGGNFPN